MNVEQYPARVVVLKPEIPKRHGYYWWKEDVSAGLEIVKLDEDLNCFYRMGDDRPYLMDECVIGLFGHEVVSAHTVTSQLCCLY